jgi:putative ABC transport system permease protein
MGASYDFLEVYGIKLLKGRNFSPADYNTDWNKLHNIIINSSAVKLLGFSSNHEAVGQSIMVYGRKWDIIGVINDYHQKSLRYAVEPMLLLPGYGTSDALTVKVDTKDLKATIGAIKKKYDAFFPGNLFDYFFMDEKFNALYNNDRLFGKVFALFAGFAIFIACLGLLGLSLFTTAQRIKEIGVRKVLGASIPNIVLLLSKDFIKLICIAFVIATPIAWYIMDNWLQDYAYRIAISWWMFAGAGLLALLISLATISFQAVKAALANPVKSLRTE